MPSGGGATQLALAVPRDPAYSCGLVPAASESDWVCAEIKYHSDIWLIENFDPHVN